MGLLITRVDEGDLLTLFLVLAIQMKRFIAWEGGGASTSRAQLLPLLCRQKWAKLFCFKTFKGNNKDISYEMVIPILWANLFVFFGISTHVFKWWNFKIKKCSVKFSGMGFRTLSLHVVQGAIQLILPGRATVDPSTQILASCSHSFRSLAVTWPHRRVSVMAPPSC